MGGITQYLYVCLVTVTFHIVITIYNTSFNVNLDVWPLTDFLRFRTCVGSIDDIIQCVWLTFDDVDALVQFISCFGIRYEVVASASCNVQSCVIRYLLIDKDIDGLCAFCVDTCRISHVGTTRTFE